MRCPRIPAGPTAALLLLSALVFAEPRLQHPAYLRALGELLGARAELSAGPGVSSQSSDEQVAMIEIDRAMQDVKDASEDDMDGMLPDPAPAALGDLRTRLSRAMERLLQAQDSIEQRQQGSYMKGLKANSAQQHIELAKQAICRAMQAQRQAPLTR